MITIHGKVITVQNKRLVRIYHLKSQYKRLTINFFQDNMGTLVKLNEIEFKIGTASKLAYVGFYATNKDYVVGTCKIPSHVIGT